MGDVRDSVQGQGPKNQPSEIPNEPLVEKKASKKGKKGKGKKNKKDKKGKKRRVRGVLGKGNLINQMQGMRDEVSELIMKKDIDIDVEGEAQFEENTMKASKLRKVHYLLTKAQNEMEDMYDAS